MRRRWDYGADRNQREIGAEIKADLDQTLYIPLWLMILIQ